MIERFEPDSASTLPDLIVHQELLFMKCKRLIEIVKRAASNSCCICCDSCLACDAKDLLNELGIDNE